jgi:hypothetical protein
VRRFTGSASFYEQVTKPDDTAIRRPQHRDIHGQQGQDGKLSQRSQSCSSDASCHEQAGLNGPEKKLRVLIIVIHTRKPKRQSCTA